MSKIAALLLMGVLALAGALTLSQQLAQSEIPLPSSANRATTELLINNGFEFDADLNKIPDDWTGKNTTIARSDKRKCNQLNAPVAHTGNCAFMFRGNPNGITSKLQQTIADTSAILDGVNVTFSVYVDARSAIPNTKIGVATITTNDNTTSKFILRLPAARGVEDYQLLTDTQTIMLPVGVTVTSAKVDFRYGGTTGKFLIDDASFAVVTDDPTTTPSGTFTLTANVTETLTPTLTLTDTLTATTTISLEPPTPTVTSTPTATTDPSIFSCDNIDAEWIDPAFYGSNATMLIGNYNDQPTELLSVYIEWTDLPAPYDTMYLGKMSLGWSPHWTANSPDDNFHHQGPPATTGVNTGALVTGIRFIKPHDRAFWRAEFYNAPSSLADYLTIVNFTMTLTFKYPDSLQPDCVVAVSNEPILYPTHTPPAPPYYPPVKLVANDGTALAQFGASVAIEGQTAAVGAFTADFPRGAVYIFTENNGIWTQQQKLFPEDAAADEQFGFGISLALSGNTLVIGAIDDDIDANNDQGSAYIFTRSNGIWTQQQKLVASDGASNDYFGISIAIHGDTVLVGTQPTYSGSTINQSAVYVFTRSGTTWTQQAKLMADDGVVQDSFGRSVALKNDTAVIGAIGANVDQGAVYVFTRNGTIWTQQQKITADDGAAGDSFGWSVATNGVTLVTSARRDDIGQNIDQGSAYVFVLSGNTWIKQTKLIAPDGEQDDWFGQSVAIFGTTILISNALDDIGANLDQGSVYVFSRYGMTWWYWASKLTASDGAAGDAFGSAVALYNRTALLGSVFDDINANDAQGSAWVFTLPSNFFVAVQNEE